MAGDLPRILAVDEDTSERYCRCERYIIGCVGREGLRRFESLGMEPDVVFDRYVSWLRRHTSGDMRQFLIWCEQCHAYMEEAERPPKLN